MRLHIRHETTYRYASPIGGIVQTVRLTPRADPHQRIVRWVVATPGRRFEHVDAFGNCSHLVTVEEARDSITLVATGLVDVEDCAGRIPQEDGSFSPLVYLGPTPLTQPTAPVREFAAQLGVAQHAEAMLAVAGRIRERIEYVPGATDVDHEAADVLSLGKGVCQDHAHLFLAVCRARGLPARYVSGYLHTGDADVASHAWVDVWLGAEQGWFSIDVTHAAPTGGSYCRLAVGRDYLDACPVRGMRTGGGKESMAVRVYVAATSLEQQQQQQQQLQQPKT